MTDPFIKMLQMESIGLESGGLTPDEPLHTSEVYENTLGEYPKKITVELWNVPLEYACQRLVEGLPQRLVVGWPEIATQFEIMVVPLNNKWYETRMTGTSTHDGPYYFVGIDRLGCYPLRIENPPYPSYIGDKLGLGIPESVGMHFLFQELSSGIERHRHETSKTA